MKEKIIKFKKNILDENKFLEDKIITVTEKVAKRINIHNTIVETYSESLILDSQNFWTKVKL